MAAIVVIKVFALSSLVDESSVRPEQLCKDTRRDCRMEAEHKGRGIRGNERGARESIPERRLTVENLKCGSRFLRQILWSQNVRGGEKGEENI